MKNRTVLGIICIALALVLCFGVGPLINNLTDGTIEAVRIKEGVIVASGSEITGEDIEMIKVKKSTFNSGVYYTYEVFESKFINSSSDDYLGVPFADCELGSGEFIPQKKVSINGASSDAVFEGLGYGKMAMSITLDTFADGLSGKLENGDIVSVVAYTTENDIGSVIPEELKFVKVITTTTSSGVDQGDITKNEDGSMSDTVSTATLLVDERQAVVLNSYLKKGKVTLTLRCRNTSPEAESLLEQQEEILNGSFGEEVEIPEEITATVPETPSDVAEPEVTQDVTQQ